MHRDVEHVVRDALARARAMGLDEVGQLRTAMRWVMRVRPDLNLEEAKEVVTRLRWSERAA